jgi:WhiB family transcriptional regulator, redox-sensing transcriptional regulator
VSATQIPHSAIVAVRGLLAREDWMRAAACRGRNDLFFPPLAERPQSRVRRERQAQALCEACPVTATCRDHARVHREFGYWGGESEAARTAAGFAVPNPIGARRPTVVREQGPDAQELDAAS